MKFTKDQIQKAILAVILCCGGLWYYVYEIIEPLAKRETVARQAITTFEGQIKEAKSKILRTSAIESGDIHAAEAQRVYAVMKAKIPNGQPVAWLPTRLGEFFKQRGIGKPTFRGNSGSNDCEFPGYKTSSWAIELPSVGYSAFGEAVADLENQEGLMQITGLQIDSLPGEAELHHAQLTISTLVKSEK